MDETVLTAIAAAVAGGAATHLTETGSSALRTLVDLIRNRLGLDASSRAVLDAARDTPSQENDTALVSAVRAAVAGDEQFAREAERLWQQVQGQPSSAHGGVVNTVAGHAWVAGPVVQARDITGGIRFGPPPPDVRDAW
ncbi:hypothetical protein [Plantactinospora sp. CA-290183]|uniref:hypothetical protein n=1 Tax=Plantactinospora sp. CA-290183 TaxID=3240006 RepID=UPI003D90BD56